MSDLKKHITISKDIETGDDLDYQYLREKGLEYIEALSGSVWTDYNTHDPGITILEMLCYALTDLGMRINMPIENILTPADSAKAIEEQFFKATQILPSKPITANDYRKLFIDIDGVKNCWLQKFEKQVYVDCKNSAISYNKNDFSSVADQHKTDFTLNGLYSLLVDFGELDDEQFSTKPEKEAEIERIKNEILSVYHQNRNLCEDLIEIKKVDTHPVEVCAKIELETDADEEMVHALVLRTIETYFSPNLWFYSLKQMFDSGYTSDQIFEGPTLSNGFLDPAELEAARLRTEVRLSDIMKLLMKIPGVKVIHEITINDCISPKEGDIWLLCIDMGKKPKLCAQSAFSYYKGVLPLNVNSKKVKENYEKLEEDEKALQELANVGMEIKVPAGTYLETGETTTIQNDFPETYGIGQIGLSPRVSVQRKSQAKQLKGYLLFFDQVFASYFAHLDKVKDLLSVDSTLAKTYFTQVVSDIKDFDELVSGYPLDDEELTSELLSDLDENVERKNVLLNHLIARFAERFSEYSFLMKELYGDFAEKAAIQAKEVFLSEYGEITNAAGETINKGISNWRGSAFNYFKRLPDELWDTENVAGAQKRIARLCGINDFSRRNLSESYVEVYDLIDSNGNKMYRWHIKDADGTYILSATDDYKTPALAEEEMYEAMVKIVETPPETISEAFKSTITDLQEIANFKIQISDAGKYSFDIINTEANPQSVDWIIARQFLYYETQEKLEAAILEIIRFFTHNFSEEGMFIVEHILLRPDVTESSVPLSRFMPVCTDNCENSEPLDPYSYRVTVVLPGWTYRFANRDFRNFMEELIRKELPAHVLSRICWIGDRKGKVPDDENEMILFENAYKNFLLAKTDLGQEQNPAALEKLIDIITRLNSIYPTGRLIDCEDEEDSTEGRIILGRTNIGNL